MPFSQEAWVRTPQVAFSNASIGVPIENWNHLTSYWNHLTSYWNNFETTRSNLVRPLRTNASHTTELVSVGKDKVTSFLEFEISRFQVRNLQLRNLRISRKSVLRDSNPDFEDQNVLFKPTELSKLLSKISRND